MADPLFHVISYLSLQSVLVSTVMLLKDLKWCTLYTRFGKNTVAVDTEKTAKYMGNRRNLNHQEGSSLITNQYQYYNKKTLWRVTSIQEFRNGLFQMSTDNRLCAGQPAWYVSAQLLLSPYDVTISVTEWDVFKCRSTTIKSFSKKNTKMDSILDFSFCHTVFIELTVSVLPSMIETQRQYIDLQYWPSTCSQNHGWVIGGGLDAKGERDFVFSFRLVNTSRVMSSTANVVP